MSLYPAVTVQPEKMGAPKPNPRLWSSSVFSCMDDTGSCILGAFCPCILSMKVAGEMGESPLVPFCVPGASIVMRTKLRTAHNIQGSVMNDCCVVAFCEVCVLCQLAREQDYIRRVGLH